MTSCECMVPPLLVKASLRLGDCRSNMMGSGTGKVKFRPYTQPHPHLYLHPHPRTRSDTARRRMECCVCSLAPCASCLPTRGSASGARMRWCCRACSPCSRPPDGRTHMCKGGGMHIQTRKLLFNKLRLKNPSSNF